LTANYFYQENRSEQKAKRLWTKNIEGSRILSFWEFFANFSELNMDWLTANKTFECQIL
jgi:hypothetical protein